MKPGRLSVVMVTRVINEMSTCDLAGVRGLQPHGQNHPGHLVPIRPESDHSEVHGAEAAGVPLHHHGERSPRGVRGQREPSPRTRLVVLVHG